MRSAFLYMPVLLVVASSAIPGARAAGTYAQPIGTETLLPTILASPGGHTVVLTEFTIPTENSYPTGITVGPDGALWFVESRASQIGRIDIDGSIREFPAQFGPGADALRDIVAGPDGALWFTLGSDRGIGRITTSGVVSAFSTPGRTSAITVGPDNALWFTQGGSVGRLTLDGSLDEFPPITYLYLSFSIATGPDGALWLPGGPGMLMRIATDGSTSEFPIPTRSPGGIVGGPDGAIWYTESTSNQIGRITVEGVVSQFPIPTRGIFGDMTVGPDGALWFTRPGGTIGRITVDGTVAEFPLPRYGSRPQGIVAGPDGALWFTQASGNRIGRLSIDWPRAIDGRSLLDEEDVTRATFRAVWGGQDRQPAQQPARTIVATPSCTVLVTQFPPLLRSTTGPRTIAAGPDGAIWFTAYNSGSIGRITTDGVMAEFPIPSRVIGLGKIAVGSDDALWFTEFGGNRIGRITMDGVITELPVPRPMGSPFGIATGPDGALWFAPTLGDHIGRITTDGAVSAFPLPTPDARPAFIVAGPDGALWFTQRNANSVGRISPEGHVREFAIPTGARRPADIGVSLDDELWFTTEEGGRVWFITMDGITRESQLGNRGVTGMAVGPDGALWFTSKSGSVGRWTRDAVVSEFRVSGGWLSDITVGPDGALWFAQEVANRIGRITPCAEDAEHGWIFADGIVQARAVASPVRHEPDQEQWVIEHNAELDRLTRSPDPGVAPSGPAPR